MSALPERATPQPVASFPIRGVGLSIQVGADARGSVSALAAAVSARLWALSSEFPSVRWALMGRPPSDALVVPVAEWRASPMSFAIWDRAVANLSSRPRWVVVHGDEPAALEQTAREVLTRYQRLVPRTNAHSATPAFRRVLSGHRAMHDLTRPLVSADYDHALDAWQWVLRLAPLAPCAVQLAALFHDVERLISEADRRVEHTAPDYQAFKNAHAEHGAELAAEVLGACGVEASTCAEVASLIREHELPQQPARSADRELLADADALSFFSLNSPGFADYYGPEHTQMKVRYTLGRMSSGALGWLAGVRLRKDIAQHLEAVARAEALARLEQARA